MANVPKPELERGNYLVYTNEPDAVIDSPGGGGGGEGGIVYLQADPGEGTPVPQFSFNQVKSAFDSGKLAVIKVTSETENFFLYIEAFEANEDPEDPSYTVTAKLGLGEITFVSNGPDKLMTAE